MIKYPHFSHNLRDAKPCWLRVPEVTSQTLTHLPSFKRQPNNVDLIGYRTSQVMHLQHSTRGIIFTSVSICFTSYLFNTIYVNIACMCKIMHVNFMVQVTLALRALFHNISSSSLNYRKYTTKEVKNEVVIYNYMSSLQLSRDL